MRALAAWLLWLVSMLVAGAVLLSSGVQLDTRLADLSPRSERADATGALAERADRLAAESVRIAWLTPAGKNARNRLDGVQTSLVTALDALPEVERLDREVREARLVELLAPHRFSLLPSAVTHAAGQSDAAARALAEDAIAALYAPDLALRPLPVDSDPLNLLGEWLDERLRKQLPDSAPGSSAEAEQGSDVSTMRWLDAKLRSGDERGTVQRIEQALAAVADAYPDVEILRTGVPFFAADAAERSRSDIDRISIGSLLGLLVLLVPVFRSISPLLLPAFSIAVGAASGTVLVLLVHGSMHVLTLVFGASLIGIVIDYSVHGFAHRSADQDNTATLPRPLVRALALGLLTSSIGYAALGLSSVPQLARVALFSVGGLFGAWLTVLAWLPRLGGPGVRWHAGWVDPAVRVLVAVGNKACQLAGLPTSDGAPAPSKARSMLRPASRSVVVALSLCAFAVFCLLRLQADDDPRRLIDLSPTLIDQAQRIASQADDPDVARRLLITARDTDGAWQALALLRQKLQPTVGITLTAVDDWLPSPARMHRDRQQAAWLLSTGGAVEQVLIALGENAPETVLSTLRRDLAADEAQPLQAAQLLDDPAMALPPLLHDSNDGVAALALVSPTVPDAGLSARLRAGIDTLRLPAGVQVDVVDAVADTAMALGEQRRSAFALLAWATAAVAAVLLLVYRRWSVVVLVAVPAGAIIATLAVFGALGIPLTLFHVMGLFLVLGLGMDYTIFLAELGQHARRTTLAAIVLSAATSLLSFGLLAMSSIPVARFFAQTVFIGNAFSLVFSFMLLGTLMARAPTRSAPVPDTVR